MRKILLPILCCPETGEDLTLEIKTQDETGDILEGTLRSPAGNEYPITNGVPRFTKSSEVSNKSQTVRAFGKEWEHFDDFKKHINSKELLFEFMHPVNEETIKGKKVIELGCGGGRWLERFAECGAELVVGIDLSTSVEQAVNRTRKYKNVEIIQADILKPPVKRVFDLTASLGVIHHLPEPAKGITTGIKTVKTGGRMTIWIYSKEGNELYLRLVKPLRKICPLLPHSVLLVISYLLAVPVYLHACITNPIFKKLNWKLPLLEYLGIIRKLRFVDLVNVVYDQLAPNLAFYASHDDVMKWVNDSQCKLVELTMRTNNSWRIHLEPE
ncbi:methyltransferase domain-containing protein [Planctomycetota bacterium]